jgi:4-hydroxybenzoate polyprenyltransferase
MQILLDCKDVESDFQKKLLTIPAIFGREKTFHFLRFFSIISTIGFIVALFAFFSQTNLLFVAILGVIPFNLYSIHLAQKGNYHGYTLVSAEFAIWAGLFLLASFFSSAI